MSEENGPVLGEQQRLFLAIGLSLLVILVWQRFFMPKSKLLGQIPADAGHALVAAPSSDGGVLAVAAPAAVGPPPVAVKTGPEEVADFDSPTSHLVFGSYGGGLKSAVLKGEQFKREVNGEVVQVDLAKGRPGSTDPLPLSTALGEGLPPIPADLPYAMERTGTGVRFTARVGNLEIVKEYLVPKDGYDLELRITLKNLAAAPVQGSITTVFDSFVAPSAEQSGSFLSRGPTEAHLPLARVNGTSSPTRHAADKDKGPEILTGQVSYAGLDERYFLAAMYPAVFGSSAGEIDAGGSGSSERTGKVVLSSPADGLKKAELTLPTPSIAPGGSYTRTLGVYLGPKLQETLHDAGRSLPDLVSAKPDLETAVDYGYVAVISTLLLKVMRLFYQVIPNWGVAILLLTLAVKAALFPLTQKQMASMEAMRQLQPQIKAIQDKYKDDKERQNTETMKLYQEKGVNPLGGCLPMLVQMPVWWGLYRTLEYAFDLYRQPFIAGWVTDLSSADHTYVLPVLMGATMFLSQKMQPQVGADQTQAKIMLYAMPGFFTFVMLKVPAGLNLYIFFNNILSIAQQMWLRRRLQANKG